MMSSAEQVSAGGGCTAIARDAGVVIADHSAHRVRGPMPAGRRAWH